MFNRVASWFGAPPLDVRHLRRIELQTALNAEAVERFTPQVARALDYWRAGVLEPDQSAIGEATPQADAIDDIIRADDKGAWNWVDPYRKNGQRAWCGHFAAACFGESLPKPLRQKVLASCSRLVEHGPDFGVRRLAPADAQPGDVLVVQYGRGGNARTGDHICLVERVDRAAGIIYTIEGNASGWVTGAAKGDAGACREGVIRRTRPIGRASNALCPVSGLKQTAGAFAVYRMPVPPPPPGSLSEVRESSGALSAVEG